MALTNDEQIEEQATILTPELEAQLEKAQKQVENGEAVAARRRPVAQSGSAPGSLQERRDLREELQGQLKQVFESALAHKDHGNAVSALRERAHLGGLL